MGGVSTFFGLQTSLSGLLAHQRSLDVTGHNVSNASTVGYSRQEVVLGSAPPLFIPSGARIDGSGAQLGSGVGVQEYRRIRDGFLDVQYRSQAGVLGEAEAKARSLEGVDLALAEPSDNGRAAQLGKLWSAFSSVANDPSSVAARQSVIEQAKTVASAFAQLDGQLGALQGQAQAEFDALVASPTGQVANIAGQLKTLTESIMSSLTGGQTPLDLLDARDNLLDQLSTLGNTSVVDLGNGAIRVLFGNTGEPLVDLTGTNVTVTWPQDLTTTNPGGKLGGLYELSRAGGVIDSYRDELGDVAEALAESINVLHRQGDDPLADFFTYDDTFRGAGLTVVANAATMQLGRPIGADPATKGANDIAREIAALRGGAVDSAYNGFVSRIGAEIGQNVRVLSNAQILTNAVQDRRESASGVSLDEEMTNLIRFQRGYQASARTMSTLDEMLDVLINRTGRVGL